MSEFYESDRAVNEYLLFHYGAENEVMPYADGPLAALNYPVRCVTTFADRIGFHPAMRALDLGCAVGRSSFELARVCGEVVGIDFSERFIACADHLRRDGEMAFSYVDHGELERQSVARVDGSIDRGRVHFEQGDAMFPRDGLGRFDVVLMANLIDRLMDPSKCLKGLEKLVNPGGFVILTSPYTWLAEYTPKSNWIGGKLEAGREVTTLLGLKNAMKGGFDLIADADLPFLIREHARKFQWSVAQGTLWQRLP